MMEEKKSSVDKIAEKAKKEKINVKVVHREKSYGKIGAVANEGIKSSESDYIVIHDDDDGWHPPVF